MKSDQSPATFWTASPDNIWRHNVATGSSAVRVLAREPEGLPFSIDLVDSQSKMFRQRVWLWRGGAQVSFVVGRESCGDLYAVFQMALDIITLTLFVL